MERKENIYEFWKAMYVAFGFDNLPSGWFVDYIGTVSRADYINIVVF